MDEVIKINNSTVQVPDPPKQILTRDMVENALRKQRNSVLSYLAAVAGIGISVALGAFVFPPFYLFIVNCLLELKKMITADLARKNLHHHVITRPCVEKKIAERESDPDQPQLWFYNRDGDWIVAVNVDEDFYNATQLDEKFHLVFAEKEKTPCLWYRASEWELDESSWNVMPHQKEKV